MKSANGNAVFSKSASFFSFSARRRAVLPKRFISFFYLENALTTRIPPRISPSAEFIERELE